MTSYKTQIIIVASEYPPGPGGIADHAYNLATGLSGDRYPVRVISERRQQYENADFDVNQFAAVQFANVNPPLRWWNFFYLVHHALVANRGAVFIATGSKSLIAVGFFSYFVNVKSVAILHGHEVFLGSFLKRNLVRKALKNFTVGVAVSEFSKQNSSPYMIPEKIEVISNGINPGKFSHRISVAKELQGTAINLLTVGRISKRKGQHNVVSALPAILKKYPGSVYHVVGIDDEGDQLMGLAKSLHVHESLKIYGAVSNQRLGEIYLSCDIFLMLSEKLADGDAEGFGIAILEANYFGLPAIGSRGCGIEQAIRDGYSGLLVNGQNVLDAVAAIDKIMAGYETWSGQSLIWANQLTMANQIRIYEKLIDKIA